MAGQIFINYRRKATPKDAQLILKVLQQHFGSSRVFLDTSGLYGEDHWRRSLEGQVAASAAMVTLIGHDWLGYENANGGRAIDDPGDFVRLEIAQAFACKIPVLPVLIDGAGMPDTDLLPANLKELSFQQAMPLRFESFDADAAAIAQRLKLLITKRKPGMSPWTVAAISAATLIAGAALGPAIFEHAGIDAPFTQQRPSDALASELKTSEESLARQQTEALRLNKLLDEARDQIATLSKQLDDPKRLSESGQPQADALNEQIAAKDRKIASLQSDLEAEERARADAQSRLTEAETKAQTLEAQVPLPEISLGDPKAPVTITEFSSLSCSHCATFHKNVFPSLKSKYIDTGKARYVVREFPLDNPSLAGAVLARCMGSPSRHLAFVEMLLEKQTEWSLEKDVLTPLKAIAREAGMSAEDFDRCVDNETLQKRILAVREEGQLKGINAAPSFLINGTLMKGPATLQRLSEAMQPFLGKEH